MFFFKNFPLIISAIILFTIFFNINKSFCYSQYIKNKYNSVGNFYMLVKNIRNDAYIKNTFYFDKHFYGFIKNSYFDLKKHRSLNKVEKSSVFGKKKIKIKNICENKISKGKTESIHVIDANNNKNEDINRINNNDLNIKGDENNNVSIHKNKKKLIRRDADGLPVEKLKIQRLPNSKIKTKYKYCKIKKYSETININYRKRKILSIHEGKLKNKKIYSPDTYTRPMMSKVKESIFNILTHLGIFSCYDINVIDIFSGSGNLGIECMSRNVDNVTFVDLSINSCRTIYENLKLCNLSHLNSRIIRSDAIELLQNPFKFDLQDKFHLGFFTPPYEQIVYSDLIHSISKSQLFHNDSLIFIEYPKEIELLPQKINNLIGLRNRKFGRTYYALYVLNNTGKYISNEKKEEFYPLHYNRKQRRQEKYI